MPQAHDLFALLNADAPVLSAEGRAGEAGEELQRYALQTSAGAALDGADRRLGGAYAALRDNLAAFQALCRPSADLVRSGSDLVSLETLQ